MNGSRTLMGAEAWSPVAVKSTMSRSPSLMAAAWRRMGLPGLEGSSTHVSDSLTPSFQWEMYSRACCSVRSPRSSNIWRRVSLP